MRFLIDYILFYARDVFGSDRLRKVLFSPALPILKRRLGFQCRATGGFDCSNQLGKSCRRRQFEEDMHMI